MKLADFFINIGVKGDTAKLKEIDKTIKSMEQATKRQKDILKYRKELAKATSTEAREQVKKNFADKIKLENLKKEQSALMANKNAFLGAAKGIAAFVGSAVLAYNVIDRMAQSLARTNQQMISFQRTTGISLSSLNKYASANAAVNYNSSIEGTAQSMQRVAQNLWDIRMGRGDISPYQELAYVGGKAFNPMGMTVEQVIENVREAIKGVGDLQATNIITRMGFSPDDLLMLRMSREEFEKIEGLFLNREQREAMNQYALQMKQIQLQFNLLKDKSLLKIMPLFISLSKWLTDTANLWGNVANGIIRTVQASEALQTTLKVLGVALAGFMIWTHPILAAITALYLIIEDIAVYFMGGKSLTGELVKFIQDLGEKIANSRVGQFFKEMKEGIESLTKINVPNWLIGLLTGNWMGAAIDLSKAIGNDFTPSTSNNSNVTTNNDSNIGITINTTQPIEAVMSGLMSFNPVFGAAFAVGNSFRK
jgi:hypothetical protein